MRAKGTITEQARRRQIVAAAIEVIAGSGAQASFKAIAQEAGLSSTGLISYHFANRQELIEEVGRQILETFGTFVLERTEGIEEPAEVLHGFVEANIAFLRTHRSHAAALVRIKQDLASPDPTANRARADLPPADQTPGNRTRLERAVEDQPPADRARTNQAPADQPPADQAPADRVVELARSDQDRLAGVLRLGQASGVLREFDPHLVAVFILSIRDGIIRQLEVEPGLDLDAAGREFAALVDLATRKA